MKQQKMLRAMMNNMVAHISMKLFCLVAHLTNSQALVTFKGTRDFVTVQFLNYIPFLFLWLCYIP